MGAIGFNGVAAAIRKNTYGTEADLTGGTRLFAINMGPSGGYADRVTRDFGLGGKRLNNARGAGTFDFSMSHELTYYQSWMVAFAGLMGTESTPVEQTEDEEDYLSNFDVADATEGNSYTVAYTVDTSTVLVVPSFTPMSATIEVPLNGAGTVNISGVADQIKKSSTNTVAELKALVPLDYEEAELGGAGHYARFADYSTDTALDSGDEKDFEGFRITINRAKERRFGLRGALSKFTKEPLQLGLLDVTLEVNIPEYDSANIDAVDYWENPVFKMAEFYFSGNQINGGIDRSFKFQFPRLKVKGAFPGGLNVTSNSGLFKPNLAFDACKTLVAPAGMTGVTENFRMVATGPTKSTKFGT